MNIRPLLFLIFFLNQYCTAASYEQVEEILYPRKQVVSSDNCNNWKYNPYISSEERRWITPYLIPSDHPIKRKLDQIFKNERATSDEEAAKKAGFTVFVSGSGTRIASHPKLVDRYGQHYLIKFHYDNDLLKSPPHCVQKKPVYEHVCRACPSWKQLLNRAMAARKIDAATHILKLPRFIAPKKWLYPLPRRPYEAKEGYKRKNYILVVEKLNLFEYEKNKYLWKNRILKNMLEELYTMVSLGLGDVSHENLQFTRTGKWAFIDGECCFWGDGGFQVWPHPGYSLSAEMRAYWDELCRHNKFHWKNIVD